MTTMFWRIRETAGRDAVWPHCRGISLVPFVLLVYILVDVVDIKCGLSSISEGVTTFYPVTTESEYFVIAQ